MRYIIISLLGLLIGANVLAQTPVDSLYEKLDEAISQRDYYREQREKRIQESKTLFADTRMSAEQQYELLSQIFEEYRSFQLDSALLYLDKKIELSQSNEKWFIESIIQQIKLLSATGMYMEAMESLEKLNRQNIPSNQLGSYYIALAGLFNQMAYYSRMPNAHSHYAELTSLYRDSLFMVLPVNSRDGLKEKEMALARNHHHAEAREIATSIILEMRENHPDYAYYAYRIASNYRDEKNDEKEKEYLIRSAISDIRNSTTDNASLSMLAMILYREKHISEAYNYIQVSLDDATYFNAPLRFAELSSMLPVINEAYLMQVERERTNFQYFLFLIGFLVVTLASLVFFIFIQNKQLTKARQELQKSNEQLNLVNQELSEANIHLNSLNDQLSEANHIKEQYVGLFLTRCSDYIDKIDNVMLTVNKMVAAHKYTELFDFSKSNNLVSTELAEFYRVFDQSFLAMFPDFVAQVNALLSEDGQLIPKRGELLNTELRMFALFRLGITDSSKIATLLRYSVNTIYNYRTKIKNKAIVPKDSFEDRIQKI